MKDDISDIYQRGDSLPDIIPIFPLAGVLLLPGGQLPLNIFEKQYVSMVEDVLKNERIIGIIQPNTSCESENGKARPVFKTGCAGRITSFAETDDGRYEIILTGLSRFVVHEEIDRCNGYRRIKSDWSDYSHDLTCEMDSVNINRERLYSLLEKFLTLHDISCSWESIKAAPDSKLITALSMICPLEPSEKQGLLEAPDCEQRAELFMTMMELAIRQACSSCDQKDQKH